MFPSQVEHQSDDGQVENVFDPVKEGTDVQSFFFDMWRQEHADAELQPVPADMVLASGSALDPHITLDNALWPLDRVAAAWSKKTKKEEATVRSDSERQMRETSAAPLGGVAGVPLVNVLEINLPLQAKYGSMVVEGGG